MQVCTNCAVRQLDGTIFCAECGASMSLAPAVHRPQATVTCEPVASDPWYDACSPSAFQLYVYTTDEVLDLVGQPEVLIGRASPSVPAEIGVDLSPFMASNNGVSRRHALLHWQGTCYAITDLESTNGTFVNGRPLTPQQPARLSPGDEIRLGGLIMQFQQGSGHAGAGRPGRGTRVSSSELRG